MSAAPQLRSGALPGAAPCRTLRDLQARFNTIPQGPDRAEIGRLWQRMHVAAAIARVEALVPIPVCGEVA